VCAPRLPEPSRQGQDRSVLRGSRRAGLGRSSRENVGGQRRTVALGEHRAAIAAGHRGATEERWCEHCGDSLGVLPVGSTRRFCNRSHAKASQWANERDKLIEAQRGPGEERWCKYCGDSLGWVPTHRFERGEGRFCGHSHRMRWQWEQTLPGLLRERSGREVKCPKCGREKGYRRPSRIGTEYCASCSSGLQKANLALYREKARRTFEELLKSGDALSRHDVSRQLQRSGGHLTRWIRAGVLPTREERVPGMGRVHLFDRATVERLERRRVARKLPRRVKRIVDLAPRRRGAPKKDAQRAELRRLFYKLRREFTGRSDWDVCTSVADRYVRAHPEGWPRYKRAEDGGLRPEDEVKATHRVWKAVQ
jgi:hypothetical protein